MFKSLTYKDRSLLFKLWIINQPNGAAFYLINTVGLLDKQSVQHNVLSANQNITWKSIFMTFLSSSSLIICASVPGFFKGRTRGIYHRELSFQWIWIFCVCTCVLLICVCVYLVFVAQCWQIKTGWIWGQCVAELAWFPFYYPTVAWPASVSHTLMHIVPMSSAFCWNISHTRRNIEFTFPQTITTFSFGKLKNTNSLRTENSSECRCVYSSFKPTLHCVWMHY